MRAVAHDKKLGKRMGIAPDVAKEFNASDPGGKLPKRKKKRH